MFLIYTSLISNHLALHYHKSVVSYQLTALANNLKRSDKLNSSSLKLVLLFKLSLDEEVFDLFIYKFSSLFIIVLKVFSLLYFLICFFSQFSTKIG